MRNKYMEMGTHIPTNQHTIVVYFVCEIIL